MATSTALNKTCCAVTGRRTATGWQQAARTALCTFGMQVRAGWRWFVTIISSQLLLLVNQVQASCASSVQPYAVDLQAHSLSCTPPRHVRRHHAESAVCCLCPCVSCCVCAVQSRVKFSMHFPVTRAA